MKRGGDQSSISMHLWHRFTCVIVLLCFFALFYEISILCIYTEEKWRYRWVLAIPHQQLGNQLWIIASSYGIAKARGARWCILDCNGQYGKYLSYLEWIVDAPETCLNPYVWFWITDEFHYIPIFKLVPENGKYATFNQEYLEAPEPHIFLPGYLQSYKYFDKAHPLPFRLAATERAQEWVKARNITAAIHIRRGDKLHDEGNVITPPSYFPVAMSVLRTLFPRQHQIFVIVTDDPQWAREQSCFHGMQMLNSVADAGFDMAVISACKHKILTIGTFGWMGAFIGDHHYQDNGTGIVVYPKAQMNSKQRTAGFKNEDYFPHHWIGIDASQYSISVTCSGSE